jgi:hypothetical protein
MKRISEVSDSIIEGAEAILMRIDGAQEVKRQLETMVHALAGAAEDLAAESETGRRPPGPRAVTLDDDPTPRVRAVPDIEPDPANVTELHVPKQADPPPAEPGAEPVPDEEPSVTEAAAAAPAEDSGPAEPADLEPVDVVPGATDDEDVEVVDAVEVVDEEPAPEPEPEPEPEQPSAVQRLRKAATSRGENGKQEQAKEPAAGEQPEQRGFDGDDMLAARLVALQMAVAGSARSEVEAHLRKTFELDEPGAILNDVFGAESKL